MDADDLLEAARHLASRTGKPRQAFLRRAVGTAYYAMFHCLAKNCADLLIGGTGAQRSEEAWALVYRALDHGTVRNVCSNSQTMRAFPQHIQDFGNTFVTMQKKRHDADYDPQCSVFKSAVLADINGVETVLADFEATAMKDRRAFAAAILFKKRP
ncbi:hypothetical protein SSBR45G_23240 [Bradyrhizobium sp. SSBR45G]|uniref:hypothetical protein n=1 Tax=unclassified Bradyrhizobium TaxID=2631580 RepID=UPI0023429837|nr:MULTISPECIES: hypothetical protein [unclassified Bradyrhizobium]GLH77416.1 hypothetical protein SSBR45G_23240 [Bradyrhizobium sp. SSBR45G]GLH84478.1 hypothetical protein SSBR45R_19380 [Bradyrhizobium sp. SSBR45R]